MSNDPEETDHPGGSVTVHDDKERPKIPGASETTGAGLAGDGGVSARPIPRRVWVIGLLILTTLVSAAAWWLYWSQFVWTDDARIQADIAAVSAKIPGRITELRVGEGDQVHAGDVIVRLDDAEFREAVAQTQHDLEVQQKQTMLNRMEMEKARTHLEDLKAGARKEEIAKGEAALREAEAQLTDAEQNWRRAEGLFKDGMIASAAHDQAHLTYRVAQEGVRRAREQLTLLQAGERRLVIREAEIEVERARAAVEVAQSRVKATEAALRRQGEILDDTVIKAEQDGTIALKIAQTGDVVQPGQPIYHLVADKTFRVEANIEETSIRWIKPDDEAEISIDGYPGVPFSGKVYQIGTAANSVFSLFPAQNAPGTFVKVTQRIPVKISIDPRNYKLRPGMSVEVKIRVKGHG
jgi:membrane fusion protein, multidrug efflux system